MNWMRLLSAFIFWDSINGDLTRNRIIKEHKEAARINNQPEPVFETASYSLFGSRALVLALVYFGITFGGIALIVIVMNSGS